MDAGFGVISVFLNCDTDGFLPATYPLYLGTILTPERPPRTIVIEFQDHTWHLPVPTVQTPDEKFFLLNTHNSFTPLDAAMSSRSEVDQHKFELRRTRQKQAQFFTNPAVTAMPVIPSVTLRQLGTSSPPEAIHFGTQVQMV